MSGGISNVVIEDCKLLHGSYGIQIKTGTTRGGFVKNVSINNVEIVGTTKEAIRIDAFYGMVNTWYVACPAFTSFLSLATRGNCCNRPSSVAACALAEIQQSCLYTAFAALCIMLTRRFVLFLPTKIIRCPDPNKRVPSVIDNIRITNVAVRNANLSVHFHGTLDVPATRVSLQNVSFACDGGKPKRCGGPGIATGCCLVPECLGGVEYTAKDITPPTAMRGCASIPLTYAPVAYGPLP